LSAQSRWVIVNYDLLGTAWAGVILDEAHFIKNKSARTSHRLKLLGVSSDSRAALSGPNHAVRPAATRLPRRRAA
jgi:hypothetical protein